MKIKTSELQGAALDYAVAKCEGYTNFRLNTHRFNNEPLMDKDGKTAWLKTLDYSTDWSQGGPIIEREKIDLAHYEPTDEWQARGYVQHFYHQGYSPTPLIAAMRCYVASKLGEEVEVPNELE